MAGDSYRYDKAMRGVLEAMGDRLNRASLNDARDTYGLAELEVSTAQRRQERIIAHNSIAESVEAECGARILASREPPTENRNSDNRGSQASLRHSQTVYASSIKAVSYEEGLAGEIDETVAKAQHASQNGIRRQGSYRRRSVDMINFGSKSSGNLGLASDRPRRGSIDAATLMSLDGGGAQESNGGFRVRRPGVSKSGRRWCWEP